MNLIALQALTLSMGLVGMLGNGLILAVGIVNKKMREKEYFYPYMLAFSEFILCFTSFLAGSYRLHYIVIDFWGMNLFASDCLATHPFTHGFVISYLLIPAVNVAICVDRIVAIKAPMLYFTLSSRYIKIVCSAITVACISYWLFLMGTAIDARWDSTIPVHSNCVPTQAFVFKYYIYVHVFDALCSVLTVIMVVVMLVLLIVKHRADKVKQEGETVHAGNAFEISRKRNDRVTKMLLYVLVVSIFISCAPSIAIAVEFYKPKPSIQILQAANLLNLFNSLNNILFYMWKNKNMREAVKNLFRKSNKSSVSNSSTF